MIRIENLTKSYRTPSGRHYVFKDVTVEIPSGKSIGLIGRNGAGKSTLLSIIGGIDRPDRGRVITNKRISWPVGLSNGFQSSMTGRENVKFVARLYAARHELDEKVKFVADFCELGRFFDMPIRSYSTGMRARLGFGLSMAFDFDYYVIDEVTAVGDAVFRKKSEALMEARREVSQFIFVSHGLDEVRRVCDVGLLIGDGKVTYYPDVDEAIEVYKQANNV
ncbi:ABC transporter ATP-binding protein [Burkholderia sp. SCN-KJ]|uniref:ABC transporter ATP-binding protein n=1 Tax=Burkholderia sp. SCN-KJ TaxID=2969248 RepID=UPI002150230D|nr:ABC transporter ATP-binding protein [Burkholderia sp. SCN-KJ]MCR4465078.1 ABC transporter ATP-binding protein [Burkholderia sp. SCN-KJ]